jgi:hypothetical protein
MDMDVTSESWMVCFFRPSGLLSFPHVSAFFQSLQNTIRPGYDTHRDTDNARGFHLRYIAGLWSCDFGVVNRLPFSFWFACRQHVGYMSRVDGAVFLSVFFFAIFALAPSFYTTGKVQTDEPVYMKEYFRRNVY